MILPSETARSKKRTRVIIQGALIISNGTEKVIIKDISTSGARVHGGSEAGYYGDAILQYRNLFVAARIVWSNRGETGLSFYRTLLEREAEESGLQALMHQSALPDPGLGPKSLERRPKKCAPVYTSDGEILGHLYNYDQWGIEVVPPNKNDRGYIFIAWRFVIMITDDKIQVASSVLLD